MPETIITVDDLKKELNPDDFRTASFADDEVASRAIHKSVIWVYGKISSTKNKYDEEDEVVKTIVLKRAIYELFSYIGNESRAKAAEQDAADLIETYFGSIATKHNDSQGPSTGAIITTEPPRYGS
ncbi:MAG: hypothetical protein FWD24_01075 [Treponema sp.]|nr:hypothetical protein [Treponema sp.]